MNRLLPDKYLMLWKLKNIEIEKLQEIRIRVGTPILIRYLGVERELPTPFVSKEDVELIFEWLCGYGVYAYQEEIKRGYLTIQGGHRIGIAGQAVCDALGNVITIKYISSLNIRISHEIKDASKAVLEKLYQNGEVLNTLIFSPPACGKTSLLRDLIQKISDGNEYGVGERVSVIDEREELTAPYLGVPSYNMGCRTDVLSSCPKSTGMEMCLRSLSPKVVAVDEIYSKEDLEGIKKLIGCGCKIIATHHCDSLEDFQKKEFGMDLIKKSFFQRYLILTRRDGKYEIEGVYNQEFHRV